MILVRKETILAHKAYCEKKHLPYEFEMTGARLEMKSMFGHCMNKESKFPGKELNFIKKVKTHIVKNKLYEGVPKTHKAFRRKNPRKKIKYFYYNKGIKPGARFEGGWEVDLNSAYWEIAYQHIPILSKELYEKGKSSEISKRTRLAALGSLAKIKSRYTFDGYKETRLPQVRQKHTEFLWYAICNYMGKIMYQSTKQTKGDFMFYWVDAIIVSKKETADKLVKFFKDKGFNSKTEPVKSITFTDKNILIDGKKKWIEGKWMWEREKNDYTWIPAHWETVRPFPYVNSVSEEEIKILMSDFQ